MGKFYKFIGHLLGLLCASAFAVQALAVESTARVSTSIDAASGYRGVNSSTIRTPSGTNIRPLPSVQPPNVSKMASGGLQQAMRGTVAANDGRFSTVLNMRVRASEATLKGGVKSLLKGGLAGIALTVGLDAFLDGIDAIIEDGHVVQKKPVNFDEAPAGAIRTGGHISSATSPPSCAANGSCVYVQSYNNLNNQGQIISTTHYYCNLHNSSGTLIGSGLTPGRWSPTLDCYYMPGAPADSWFTTERMPDTAIDAAIDDFYVPEPEDWPLLSPRIEPDDIEIYDLPGTIHGEPETIIEYDPQGNPQTTTVKQPAYDLVPRQNPSPQPALDLETRLETRTYDEHGQLTGITEATSTAPAIDSAESALEIPTDCEFMPTICRFLEWFQEPDPELANEPDLASLRDDLELERNFSVGTSTAGCPAPIHISMSMFPSVEVSLQPLCDFVDLLRPLLLALAFYFSAMIVLRT